MILPIVLYGDPILKKKAEEINSRYQGLQELIDNMFETMYAADGVGFAAPQLGLSVALFVVDSSPFADDYPEAKDFKKVFINPEKIIRNVCKGIKEGVFYPAPNNIVCSSCSFKLFCLNEKSIPRGKE